MALYRRDAVIQNALGEALAGAQVYVCTQPASTGSIPPSPLATLFADSAGVNPIANPAIADGNGNAFYYVATGFYTEVYVHNGVVTKILIDQAIGFAGVTTNTFAVVSAVVGKPSGGQNVAIYTAFSIEAFPANFSNPNSFGSAGTNPNATATYAVLKNGSSVGTVQVSTGGAFTFAGSGFTLNPGDRLVITAPGVQDSTLSDVGITLVGTR